MTFKYKVGQRLAWDGDGGKRVEERVDIVDGHSIMVTVINDTRLPNRVGHQHWMTDSVKYEDVK
jgi:hypothetical protein